MDLLDQVEDAITEEELSVDAGNKGGQVTGGDSTDSKYSPIANISLNVESNKPREAPSFDSFLVLEVCPFASTCCSLINADELS